MSDEKIVNLEKRLQVIESVLEQSDGTTRIELAEATFKTVLDADYHLDNKASRILSAMAFFTAAAAAIFARAYAPSLSEGELRGRVVKTLSALAIHDPTGTTADSISAALKTPAVKLLSHDLSLEAFLAYMIFVVISAGFYLAALGPTLNKPSKWLASNAEIRSRLFYDFIAQVEIGKWTNNWSPANAPIADLTKEFEANYVYESHLLAEKARCKFLWLSFGGLFFRLALLCLIVLAASLFSVNFTAVVVLSLTGWTALFAVFAFQNVTNIPKRKPEQPVAFWTIFLFVVTGVCLLCAILVLLGVGVDIFIGAGLFAIALSTSLSFIAHLTKKLGSTPFSILMLVITLIFTAGGIMILTLI